MNRREFTMTSMATYDDYKNPLNVGGARWYAKQSGESFKLVQCSQ